MFFIRNEKRSKSLLTNSFFHMPSGFAFSAKPDGCFYNPQVAKPISTGILEGAPIHG